MMETRSKPLVISTVVSAAVLALAVALPWFTVRFQTPGLKLPTMPGMPGMPDMGGGQFGGFSGSVTASGFGVTGPWGWLTLIGAVAAAGLVVFSLRVPAAVAGAVSLAALLIVLGLAFNPDSGVRTEVTIGLGWYVCVAAALAVIGLALATRRRVI